MSPPPDPPHPPYRGRIAPSPSGFLHLGHAATFLTAQHRAQSANGTLLFRNDDLDRDRCHPEFLKAALEDLRWLGLHWHEGPDLGGPFTPYSQSQRFPSYLAAFQILQSQGWIYPCLCSRRDIASALSAPHHPSNDLYPGTCRPTNPIPSQTPRIGTNWRFRIPAPELIRFHDFNLGPQEAAAGSLFGDFLVWRKDDSPSYQLATVVDDAAFKISEVVRGSDLIESTFQQLLLYRALQLSPPDFFHTPLLCDSTGKRLAKRHDALSLRTLRAQGLSPEDIQNQIATLTRL